MAARALFSLRALLVVLSIVLSLAWVARAGKPTGPITDYDTVYFVKRFKSFRELNYVWKGDDICTYDGVTCDVTKRTVSITVPGVGLSGDLPTLGKDKTFVPANSRVVSINLMFNTKIVGTLPDEWSSLTQLQEVILMNTGVKGTIPSSWNRLPNLAMLEVSNTKICGGLPEWDAASMPSFVYMNLTNNYLMTGSVPASIATFKTISLTVTGCNLCGCLPKEFDSAPFVKDYLVTGQPNLVAENCNTANACTPYAQTCSSRPKGAAPVVGALTALAGLLAVVAAL